MKTVIPLSGSESSNVVELIAIEPLISSASWGVRTVLMFKRLICKNRTRDVKADVVLCKAA